MNDAHLFVSWSLPASQKTAQKAYEFFRKLFPTFSFFISSENISSGQRWYDVISERLDACNVGIIVVTQENHLRPWIHYEAGALAKVVSKARVMPLLCGVTPGTIADTPLSAFQASELNKSGILKIADSIRELTGYAQSESDFKEHFGSLWDRYGAALCEVETATAEPKQKSSPNRNINDVEVGARLDQLTDIVRSIESRLPTKVMSDPDISRLVANFVGGTNPSSSDTSPMTSDEFIRYLSTPDARPANALANGSFNLARARKNASDVEEPDKPVRLGLLGTHTRVNPDGKA